VKEINNLSTEDEMNVQVEVKIDLETENDFAVVDDSISSLK
jgi:hypothetical protein